MSLKDGNTKKKIDERKIEGTLTEVEISQEFIEFAGFNKNKKHI